MARVSKSPEPSPQSRGAALPPAFLPSENRRAAPSPTGHHPRFLLAHARDAWTVSPAGNVIPKLSRHIIMDGVNGVSAKLTNGVLSIDDGTLRVNIQSWGQSLIPHDVDGPGTSYMVEPYPGHFTDRFTRLYEGSDRSSYDHAAYDAWVLSLVESGKIAQPRLPALDALRARLTTAHDGVATRVGGLPAGAQTQASTEMETLRKAIEAVDVAIKAAMERES